MSVKYSYIKSVHTGKLKSEIENAGISTALEYINTSGNEVDIFMADTLSGPDESALNVLVENHDPTPPITIINTLEALLVRPSAFTDSDNKRARLRGTHLITTQAGQTTEQDYVIAQDRILNGAEYLLWGGNPGDHVSFETHHPIAGLLDDFVGNWYVQEGRSFYELYPALLPAGLIIKVTYTNTGDSAATFCLNPMLHKKGT